MRKKCITFLILLLSLFAFAFADDEVEDSAAIKGCQDPVLNVMLQRGRNDDTVTLVVNDAWRGSYREGKMFQAVWPGERPGTGSQWIVMGHLEDDGYFHVHPQVHYPYSLEKGNWTQGGLNQ